MAICTSLEDVRDEKLTVSSEVESGSSLPAPEEGRGSRGGGRGAGGGVERV